MESLLGKLPSLENAHAEFVLLRACFSLPKVSYLLRVCPPSPQTLDVWRKLDGAIQVAMNDILGANLTCQAWEKAQLPISLSGLGLRSAANHSSATFLASAMDSKDLVAQLLDNLDAAIPHTDVALMHFSSALNYEEPIPIEVLSGENQCCLS